MRLIVRVHRIYLERDRLYRIPLPDGLAHGLAARFPKRFSDDLAEVLRHVVRKDFTLKRAAPRVCNYAGQLVLTVGNLFRFVRWFLGQALNLPGSDAFGRISPQRPRKLW